MKNIRLTCPHCNSELKICSESQSKITTISDISYLTDDDVDNFYLSCDCVKVFEEYDINPAAGYVAMYEGLDISTEWVISSDNRTGLLIDYPRNLTKIEKFSDDHGCFEPILIFNEIFPWNNLKEVDSIINRLIKMVIFQ